MTATATRKAIPSERTPGAIDKFALVTDKIVELLEDGTIPWRKPWHSETNAPRNLITGHVYQGLNPLLCMIDCLLNDWDKPLFMSFQQAKEQGWKIEKGAKSTWIKWAGTGVKKVEQEDGSTSEEFYRSFKWHNVFHISCIDDTDSERAIADLLPTTAPTTSVDTPQIDAVEQFLHQQQASIRYGGSEAFYLPSLDTIQLPNRSDFDSVEMFYATEIHELSHWTGHHSRLGRDLSSKFGTKDYAKEELVAELSAAFVCNCLGLDVELQHHASYLQHWLQILKSDNRAFFTAASQGKKAAELLLTNGGIDVASN
jgi:antirestriction protein ArdC